jgi:opacity protein-like surface antigen
LQARYTVVYSSEADLPRHSWVRIPRRVGRSYFHEGVFSMRLRYLTVLGTLALCLSTATTAKADGLLVPFVGVTFGGDTLQNRTVYGAALGFTGNGPVGFELDFGYAPNFFSADDEFFDLDGKLNITTFMANITFGGAPAGGGVRPFFSGGAGLIRASVTSPTDLFDDVTRNDFGINVGGGLSGYFNDHVGLRGDIRYFRSLEDSTGDDGFLLDPRDFDLGDFDFWRFTVGVAFKF